MSDSRSDPVFSRFVVIWASQLLSAIGSGMTVFVLGVYAYQQWHTATAYAVLMACYFVPSMVLMPFGGVMADRWPRRVLMIVGDLGGALVVGLLALLWWKGPVAVWQVYGAAAWVSVCTALQAPAYKAAVTDWVPEALYARASGMTQMAGAAQFLVAPVLAGALLAVTEISHVLWADAFTFMVAAATVAWVRRGDVVSSGHARVDKIFQGFFEGVRGIVAHKGVLTLTVLVSAVCFYVGVLQTLYAPMVLSLADAQKLGVALSLSATGMLVGSAIIGAFNPTRNWVAVLSWGLVATGIFYAAIGVSPQLNAIIVAGFLFFVTLPFVNTAIEVLLRRTVDNAQQGRTWSLVTAISQLGYALAFTSAGVLADQVFDPLMSPTGALASSVGAWIGVGPGRGIALMFIVCGVFVVAIAGVIGKMNVIKRMAL